MTARFADGIAALTESPSPDGGVALPAQSKASSAVREAVRVLGPASDEGLLAIERDSIGRLWCTAWSPRASEIFRCWGAAPMQLDAWLEPGQAERLHQEVLPAMASGRVARLELGLGGGRNVVLKVTPAAGDCGQVDAALLTARLTGTDTDGAAMRREGSLLRIASRAARLGAWSLDWPMRQLRVNGEHRNLLGLPAGCQPSLDAVMALVAPAYQPLFRASLDACGDSGTPFDIEVEMTTHAGGSRWMRIAGAARRDAEGTVVAVDGAMLDIDEQGATEQHLAATRLRDEAVLRAVPDLWFVMDADGRYVEVSDPNHPSLAGEWARARGARFDTIAPPEVGQMALETLARAKASQRVETMRYSLHVVDGRLRYFEARVAPMSNGQWLYITRDVTDETRVMAELAASEARYERITRATSDGVWEWTPATGENYMSPRWKELLGYADHEVPNREEAFYALVHPDDLARIKTTIEHHMQAGTPYRAEMRLRHQSGHWRWCRSRGQAELDEAGHVLRVSGTMTDVTDQRDAAIERRVLAERLRMATTAAEIGTWEAFPALGVTIWDEQMFRIVGRGPAPATDLPEAVRAAYRAALDRPARSRVAAWVRMLMSGQATSPIDVQMTSPAGEPRWATCRGMAVRDDSGAVRSLVGVMWDTTEERRLREQMAALTQKLLAQEKLTTMRLAQALHDQLGQTLAAIRLSPEYEAAAAQPAQCRGRGRSLVELVDQAIREVRRVLVDLRPPLLDEHGLAAALDNELQTRWPGHRQVDRLFDIDAAAAGVRWPAEVEYAAFMIAREAVANALQHADARTVHLTLGGDKRGLRIVVRDDGRGGLATGNSVSRPGHLGMVGIEERALAIGATLAIESPPGEGTTLTLAWPPLEAQAGKGRS